MVEDSISEKEQIEIYEMALSFACHGDVAEMAKWHSLAKQIAKKQKEKQNVSKRS